MKAQWDDCGGRILLGDKTVGRVVILRQRSGSSVLEFEFQVDSVCILALIDRIYVCVCVYIYIHTHTHIYIHIYIYTHTHTHTYIHTQTHTYIPPRRRTFRT
jgi:hypothetical protein